MPGAQYRISWFVVPRYDRLVKRRALSTLARMTLAEARVSSSMTLSVAVVEDETMRDLNERFRGVDATTDVLSFSLKTDEDDDCKDDLGEVVIALPTARRQAEEEGRSVHDELSHLLVHGILHILGYDHESVGDARKMRTREDELLGRATH